MNDATRIFRAARDTLLRRREDHLDAISRSDWPRLQLFNWVLDWFDAIARQRTARRRAADQRGERAFPEEDFPELERDA